MGDVRYLSDIDSLKQRIIAEFDDYYTNFDPCTAFLLAKMDVLAAETAGEPMISRKAAMHGMLARECPVHLFRETPFFFEISSGRGRYTWGGLQSPVGSYFHDRSAGEWLNIYGAETEKIVGKGISTHGTIPSGSTITVRDTTNFSISE